MKWFNGASFWSNVAYAAATGAFVWANYRGPVPAEIWFVYLAVVGLHVTADKLIQLRYGPPREKDPNGSN